MHSKIGRDAVSRRTFLKAGSASLVACTILPSGIVMGEAWAAMPRAVKPEVFATLVQMARDIYPHDRVADSYYAKAVEVLDEAAKADDAARKELEDGIAALDAAANKAHGTGYARVGWEAQRTALLKEIESKPFFQKMRGNLVTGLYNNHELWPLFGYEGESASKGGYINRGFSDIDWLS